MRTNRHILRGYVGHRQRLIEISRFLDISKRLAVDLLFNRNTRWQAKPWLTMKYWLSSSNPSFVLMSAIALIPIMPLIAKLVLFVWTSESAVDLAQYPPSWRPSPRVNVLRTASSGSGYYWRGNSPTLSVDYAKSKSVLTSIDPFRTHSHGVERGTNHLMLSREQGS